MASFQHRVQQANRARGFLIQGLDPKLNRMPAFLVQKWGFAPTQLIVMFLIPIIDAVAPFVAGYKPNFSFFIEFDDEENGRFYGQEALHIICQYIRKNYPDHVLILDAKDGDIGASNDGYTKRAFKGYQADAVTWDPYLGTAMYKQAEAYPGKGFIALGRTSNREGTALQNLELTDGRRIFEATVDAWMVARNDGCDIGFVAGATHPDELAAIRRRVKSAVLLIPGVGSQGGDGPTVALAGYGGKYGNMLINISSGSLYASAGESFAADAAAYMQTEKAAIERHLLEHGRLTA